MTAARFALLTAAALALVTVAAVAQDEGLIPTQILIHPESKVDIVPDTNSIKIEVNNKYAPLTALAPVAPSGVQIALLIDDGLTRNAGSQLEDIKKFVTTLPAGTEILLGYMTNGTVRVAAPFTTDYAAVAQEVRIPIGIPGQSASPYFCLSDFVKHWPAAPGKARFVMMITNGVDPYNGSTSVLNQDSPYVAEAVTDAERAGVAVSSIYFRDAGIRGGSASFSGQSYLQQVSEGTGGDAYYEGTGSPVALAPFFTQFMHSISETYVATFGADAAGGGREHLVRLKVSTSTPKLKLRHPDMVRPGNLEAGVPAS